MKLKKNKVALNPNQDNFVFSVPQPERFNLLILYQIKF